MGRNVVPARFDYQALAQRGGVVAVQKSLGVGRLFSQAMRLSTETRLTRALAQSPVIYSCVRVNADALAGIPLLVRIDEEEVSEEDELAKLLKHPNPMMGEQQFKRAMGMSLDLAGGFFLFLDGPSGPIEKGAMPERVWVVRDDLVEPDELDKSGVPSVWRVEAYGGKVLKYPDHAVAHIYHPDPNDAFRGFGAAQAAWRSADHLFRAEAFDDGLVENGGQIGGYFSHEERSLKPEQLDTLNKSISQNASRPANDRKKLVLPAGVKFTPVAFSPVDMQAIDMRKIKRDEVARIFGVPPVMLGELEDANRSSLREQRRVYYENTVIPRAEFLMEELYNQLVLRLPEKFHDRRVVLDYGSTAAMREDVDAQIERMEKLVGMGVPLAQAAEVAGLEIEGLSDEQFLSTTLRPMEIAIMPPQAPVVPGGADEEEPKPAKPEPEKTAKSEPQARERRVAAFEAEERRLKTADRRVKKAVRRAFDDYILAQIKKLREVAGAGERSGPGRPRPWSWYTESAAWSPATHAYSELLGYAPTLGADGWIEVRGVSEDELLALVLGNERRWGEELWKGMQGPLKGVIEDAAAAIRDAVGGSLVDAENPAIVEYMRRKEVQLVEGPMSVVAEQVKRALVAGMAGSSSTGTLADRVREVLEELEDELRALQDRLGTRAAMIARTETAAASNAARSAQYRASGIVQHEWASSGDDLVRDGHDIDGEIVVVGEPFSNGLRYPGDPSAPAGMVINCRCLTLAVTSEPAVTSGTLEPVGADA